MTTVVPRAPRCNRVMVKGAPEILLDLCTHIQTADDSVETLTETEKAEIQNTIVNMLSHQSLRCLLLAYKDISNEVSINDLETGKVDRDSLEKGLTLLSITGIEDPVREGVPESVV